MLLIQYHHHQHHEPKKIKEKKNFFSENIFQLTPPHIPVKPDVFRLPFSHGSKCLTYKKNNRS